MNLLKRIIRVMDLAVFAFTTIAIGGVFYEGMTLRWYDIVGFLTMLLVWRKSLVAM